MKLLNHKNSLAESLFHLEKENYISRNILRYLDLKHELGQLGNTRPRTPCLRKTILHKEELEVSSDESIQVKVKSVSFLLYCFILTYRLNRLTEGTPMN